VRQRAQDGEIRCATRQKHAGMAQAHRPFEALYNHTQFSSNLTSPVD
jgi:hypothetical protein